MIRKDPRDRIWKAKEGDIAVRDMEPDHIKSVLALLARRRTDGAREWERILNAEYKLKTGQNDLAVDLRFTSPRQWSKYDSVTFGVECHSAGCQWKPRLTNNEAAASREAATHVEHTGHIVQTMATFARTFRP